MTTFHIISLFPQSFDSYLSESILKRAQDDKKIAVKFYNPRDFAQSAKKGSGKKKPAEMTYAERRVDDKPYGGGPGMVIEALPVIRAIDAAVGKKLKTPKGKTNGKNGAKKTAVKIIFFSPSGKLADTEYVKSVAKKYTDIVLVCGRYEGIDARVKKVFKMDDVSVGPFVLTGGELPAMVIIDSVSRQIEGVLGDINSLEENRTASSDVYTRPEMIEYKGKKYRVPKVLLSGNHKLIEEWKTQILSKSKAPSKAPAPEAGTLPK
jgi:tRNA (guanine37-N1)-methyltransferase